MSFVVHGMGVYMEMGGCVVRGAVDASSHLLALSAAPTLIRVGAYRLLLGGVPVITLLHQQKICASRLFRFSLYSCVYSTLFAPDYDLRKATRVKD
jgi:hypothetical protein